jgi:hypothetical protein
MKSKKFKLAQLEMLKRIIVFAFSTTNTVITSSVVALLAGMNSLKAKVIAIDALLAMYAQVITGIAQQKKQARLDLADVAYTIMKGAYSWAIANGNLTLAAEFKTSLSRLQRMKFQLLVSKCTNWIATITPLVPSLGDYNITPAMMTDWQNKTDDLNDLLTAPQTAIKDHKTLGNEIVTEIDNAMELTKQQVNGIVATLFQSQPEYYNGYRTQREIIDPENRHTCMNATVVNELGQPYYGVKVTVDEFIYTDETTGETKTYKAKWETTDINGNAPVKTFFAATRTITVSGTGIVTKTFGPFAFEHGKTITETFIVQPSFENLPEATTETTETITNTETEKVTVK